METTRIIRGSTQELQTIYRMKNEPIISTGGSSIPNPQPKTTERYREVVELYRSTRLSCCEISRTCSVSLSGLKGHNCKYHRTCCWHDTIFHATRRRPELSGSASFEGSSLPPVPNTRRRSRRAAAWITSNTTSRRSPAALGWTARGSTEAAQAGTNLKPAFGPEKNKAAIPCFTLRRFSESLHTTGCRSVRGRAAFTDRSPPPKKTALTEASDKTRFGSRVSEVRRCKAGYSCQKQI